MSAELILQHCEKVRRTGPTTWSARCPAHDDKGPSLAIKEEDGKVLIHCFSGCSFQQIIDACGVKAEDLFPPRLDDGKPIKRTFPAVQLLEAVGRESMVIAILAQGIADGKIPTPEDLQRAHLANARIQDALSFIR